MTKSSENYFSMVEIVSSELRCYICIDGYIQLYYKYNFIESHCKYISQPLQKIKVTLIYTCFNFSDFLLWQFFR